MNEMSEFFSNIADYISRKILDEVLTININGNYTVLLWVLLFFIPGYTLGNWPQKSNYPMEKSENNSAIMRVHARLWFLAKVFIHRFMHQRRMNPEDLTSRLAFYSHKPIKRGRLYLACLTATGDSGIKSHSALKITCW